MQRRYLNVAHRGASAHAPENTLLAFERAIELGADMSELDLHLCWENRAPRPHELVTPELLRALRAAGLGIVLWHEERDDELRVLRTLDVDAICTNTPEKL